MIILFDNREKNPWDFSFYSEVEETRRVRLDFGDYTVLGKEDEIVIERKASMGELSINLGLAIDRFANEMQKMQHVKQRYIICEFPSSYIETFPVNSGIPKNRWHKIKTNPQFLFSRIDSLINDFDVVFLFAGDRQCATQKAVELLKSA